MIPIPSHIKRLESVEILDKSIPYKKRKRLEKILKKHFEVALKKHYASRAT